MKYTLAIVAASLAATVHAKKCQNITVPVTISARNGVFDEKALTPVTNIDVTNFILDLTQQGKNYSADQLLGYATVGGSYELATTYCHPDEGTPDVVQLLTHGIGFDRSYWDFSFNNYNYSYVNEAVDEYKFATFSWDRLGIAESSHGEPVNEIQAYLEVAALKALTDDLRAGSIPGVPSFEKVVHVGHSFGSQHTYLLTAKYPNISNGIALTGFSQNGSFVAYFALGANYEQANLSPALASYVDGYLASADASGLQTDFFSPNSFDPAILPYTFARGSPVTIGELLTIGGEVATPNTFPGPVLIITGERDVPYCGGNCLAAPTGYANIPSESKKYFVDASVFDVFIVPGTGHGLNLAYSHPLTYGQVNNFFVQNGNAPNLASGSSATSTAGGSSATSAAGSSSATSTPAGPWWSGRPAGGWPTGGWSNGGWSDGKWDH